MFNPVNFRHVETGQSPSGAAAAGAQATGAAPAGRYPAANNAGPSGREPTDAVRLNNIGNHVCITLADNKQVILPLADVPRLSKVMGEMNLVGQTIKLNDCSGDAFTGLWHLSAADAIDVIDITINQAVEIINAANCLGNDQLALVVIDKLLLVKPEQRLEAITEAGRLPEYLSAIYLPEQARLPVQLEFVPYIENLSFTDCVISGLTQACFRALECVAEKYDSQAFEGQDEFNRLFCVALSTKNTEALSTLKRVLERHIGSDPVTEMINQYCLSSPMDNETLGLIQNSEFAASLRDDSMDAVKALWLMNDGASYSQSLAQFAAAVAAAPTPQDATRVFVDLLVSYQSVNRLLPDNLIMETLAVLSSLIEQGADVNVEYGHFCHTPLMASILGEDVVMAQFLTRSGARASGPCAQSEENTALQQAIGAGMPPAVLAMLQDESNPNRDTLLESIISLSLKDL